MSAPSSPSREDELAALRRPFLIGVVLVLLVVALLGAVIAAFGSNADRPAGIAERWLVAVGDTTRAGVEADARHRIDELSTADLDPALVGRLAELSPTAVDEDKSAFESVRVGPPLEGTTDTAVVPARLTPRDGDPVQLYLALVDDGEGWRVLGIQAGGPDGIVGCPTDDTCPGFPLERPERAPIGWFAGALALGVLITVGCVAAVRAATPASR